MRTSPMLRLFVGVLVAGLAIAGTAGGAAADKRDDQRFVAKTVLVPADVPAGYAVQPTLKPGLPEGKVCRSMRTALRRQEKAPNSASYFRDSDTGTVIDLVTIFPAQIGAERVLAAYAAPEAGRCLARQLEAAYAPAKEEDDSLDVTIEVEPVAPGIGEESTGWHADITLANDDGALRSSSDLTVVRVGRAVARFDFGAPLTGVPDQTVMVQTVADRLGAQP